MLTSIIQRGFFRSENEEQPISKRKIEVSPRAPIRNSQRCSFKVKLTPIQPSRKDNLKQEIVSIQEQSLNSEQTPMPNSDRKRSLSKKLRSGTKKVSFKMDNSKPAKHRRPSILKTNQFSIKGVECSEHQLSDEIVSQHNFIQKFTPVKVFIQKLLENFDLLKAKNQQDAHVLDGSCGRSPIRVSKIELENGGTYQGQCHNYNREGYGRQVWLEGTVYEGFWMNNCFNGRGRIQLSNGDNYQGQWKQNNFEGQGTFLDAIKGCSYSGTWVNGQLEGEGTETWSDGAKFIGIYQNGKKSGRGKLLFSDGSFYEGNFTDNEIDGYGKYCWINSRTYEGKWLKNQMHGRGKLAYTNGSYYEGQFEYDKREGYGVFVWEDGRKYEGHWENGKQHGLGVMYTANGQKKQGQWFEGKKINTRN